MNNNVVYTMELEGENIDVMFDSSTGKFVVNRLNKVYSADSFNELKSVLAIHIALDKKPWRKIILVQFIVPVGAIQGASTGLSGFTDDKNLNDEGLATQSNILYERADEPIPTVKDRFMNSDGYNYRNVDQTGGVGVPIKGKVTNCPHIVLEYNDELWGKITECKSNINLMKILHSMGSKCKLTLVRGPDSVN